jgi:aminomethyltransferase
VSTTELHRTAFDGVQRESGASWTDWEGWAWAADFGDAVAEHNATRQACNVWDEAALRKWDIKGPDAIALADVLFTNDMAALEVGQVR